jgi:hypothetical protein
VNSLRLMVLRPHFNPDTHVLEISDSAAGQWKVWTSVCIIINAQFGVRTGLVLE